MLSYEIEARLQLNSFTMAHEQLEEITETSKQIVDVKLNQIRDVSSRYRVETNDGYCWNILVSNK